MNGYVLYTEQMSVGYNGKPLISSIEIQVNKGEILTLIGPNGSGKSTVLKSLIRQISLIGGKVYLGGKWMEQMSSREIGRTMSILMTERPNPELMTCGEMVGTGRYPYTGAMGILGEEDRRQVRYAMELVGGLELYDCPFSKISDGQRQRILLARAICQEPDVIVLDEPTSFLDIRYKLEFLEMIRNLAKERGVAVILSLHELDLAQKLSHRILCLKDGRVDRYGAPEEIFKEGYIGELYGIKRGTYDEMSGCLELPPEAGAPEVFVIGGNGSGIPVYRSLLRQGRPFAAGILAKNDLDYPTARALAAQVVTEEAYEIMGEEAYQRACQVMEGCSQVICCLKEFGTVNQMNRRLMELAERQGKLSEESLG